MARHFAILIVCALAIRLDAYSLSKDDDLDTDCLPLKQLISDSITAAGISFFADHPRPNKTFDPNDIEPFTPSTLFKKYYGDEASSAKVKEAVLAVTYAAAKKPKKFVDRNEQRRNLYKYIKAGSYEYAREKTGQLFRNIVNEYVKDSTLWIDHNCVENTVLYNVLEAVEVECYRIRNEVGDVKFGQLFSLGIGSTLAFCIDDTGSMSNEIEAAKKRAQTIVEYTQGSLDAPQDFVLVPFNDPSVGPVTVTNNAAEYHAALGRLSAHGGGDAPELSMRGIQLAIENSRPGSIIYVITDINSKDYQLQDTVIAQARLKSIVVTFLLTNRISDCPDISNLKTCMQLYRHIAQETGGQVLVIGRSDIFRATDIVQAYAKQGIVLLKQLTVTGNSKEPHKRIHFHVDNTLQELLLEAQGNCENVYLSSPESHDEHVKIKHQKYGDIWTSELDLSNFTARNPLGQWNIGFDVRTGTCSVKVQAKTAMGYIFTLFRKGRDEPEDRFEVLREDPFVDDSIAVVLDGYGLRETIDGLKDHATTLKFVNVNGKVLRTTSFAKSFEKTTNHIFHGDILQLEPFRIMVEGKDNEGHSFQRMHPTLITPSHVQVKCDLSDSTFIPGSETSANITIKNFGANDEFVLGTSDESGASTFHDGSKTLTMKIRNGEVVTKTLRLRVDEKERDGTAIKITITAKGKLPGSFQYSSCVLVVGQKKQPRIDSFAIQGTINARFAETVITSDVTNNADIGREAVFDVLLPDEAFITGIKIVIGNETIHGVIEEKKKAEKIYERAKESGHVASHVAAREKTTRSYRTAMFVEARQKVKFVLTYQQLLKRVRGRYEYAVILSPHQPIRSLSVNVHITEESALKSVRVLPLKTSLVNLVDDTPPGATITYGLHNTAAHVRYNPDYAEQVKYSPKGISGTFIIEYDVARSELAGQIALNSKYFAHFFAPPVLQPLPKVVVFAVDTSGSMYGYKMKQMKAALTETLEDLNPGDKFGLVAFGDEVTAWSKGVLLPATDENINEAVDFVRNLKAYGGTNFEAAFQALVDTLEPYLPKLEVITVESSGESSGEEGSAVIPEVTMLTADDEIPEDLGDGDMLMEEMTEPDKELDSFADEYVKMAIFMTDGRPSIGETDPKQIRDFVKEKNGGRFILNTVGIGSLVDFSLLQKLANENDGTARRIFEGIDAGVQIRNFLEELTNPILYDVTIDYPTESVEDLTVNEFPLFMGGTELVVAGRVRADIEDNLDVTDLELLSEGPPSSGSLISAQVRGRVFKEELEIDFDLDPKKQSKITESPHQIQNFTEKLWAFLRLKDILLKASIEENKTKKEELNQQALNMSLRYKFVTPLTSLVVVRPEHRKVIEEDLKKEEEAAKTTTTTPFTTTTPPYIADSVAALDVEEYADYLVDDTAMIPLTTRSREFHHGIARVAHFERLAKLIPRRGGRRKSRGRSRGYGGGGGGGGGGGFSGDPHFIIPLQSDINICFNWDGKEGEIYNLLFDPKRNIAVNGILENSPAPPNSGRVRRTYVSTLGIALPRQGKKITITPWDITIMERDLAVLALPVDARASLGSEDFSISVGEITQTSSQVTIECQGLTFVITLRRRTHSSYSRDHLDFRFGNDLRTLGRGSDGVFGQFAGLFTYEGEASRISLLSQGRPSGADGQVRSELYIRGKFVPVVERSMQLPGTEKITKCWYMHKNGVDGMRKLKSDFCQSSLFEMPTIL